MNGRPKGLRKEFNDEEPTLPKEGFKDGYQVLKLPI